MKNLEQKNKFPNPDEDYTFNKQGVYVDYDDKTTRKYLIQMISPGKLVIFNSTDNYQTPKYETHVSSEARYP